MNCYIRYVLDGGVLLHRIPLPSGQLLGAILDLTYSMWSQVQAKRLLSLMAISVSPPQRIVPTCVAQKHAVQRLD